LNNIHLNNIKNIQNNQIIKDAELDENIIMDKIYLIKYNNKYLSISKRGKIIHIVKLYIMIHSIFQLILKKIIIGKLIIII